MANKHIEIGSAREIVDRYSIGGFIHQLMKRIREDQSKLYKDRCEWPHALHTVHNPPLTSLQNGLFQPAIPHRCIAHRHFHFPHLVEPGYFHTLQVTLSEFEGSTIEALETTFTTLTKVTYYHEFHRRISNAVKIGIDLESQHIERTHDIWNGSQCDAIYIHPKRNGTPVEIHQSEGISWDSRLGYYRLPGFADGYFYDLPGIWSAGIDLAPIDETIGLDSVHVEAVRSSMLTQLVETLDGVVDMSLIKFLVQREIPILYALINQPTKELSDAQIEFLNQSTAALQDLFDAWPNPLHSFALDLFRGTRATLESYGLVAECEHCRQLYRYNKRYPEKKYCTRLGEGRDCGKKARNRRTYSRHADKWRDRNRIEMQKNRELDRKIREKYGQHIPTIPT